jgi:hypothetical protein
LFTGVYILIVVSCQFEFVVIGQGGNHRGKIINYHWAPFKEREKANPRFTEQFKFIMASVSSFPQSSAGSFFLKPCSFAHYTG